MGESILTILTLDVENLPCFGVRGGLRHNPGEKQRHVLAEGNQKSCALRYLPPYDLLGDTIFKDAEATLHLLNLSATSDSS
jgi:hypothetical protein